MRRVGRGSRTKSHSAAADYCKPQLRDPAGRDDADLWFDLVSTAVVEHGTGREEMLQTGEFVCGETHLRSRTTFVVRWSVANAMIGPRARCEISPFHAYSLSGAAGFYFGRDLAQLARLRGIRVRVVAVARGFVVGLWVRGGRGGGKKKRTGKKVVHDAIRLGLTGRCLRLRRIRRPRRGSACRCLRSTVDKVRCFEVRIEVVVTTRPSGCRESPPPEPRRRH